MDISAVVLSFNSKRYIETCIRDLMQSYQQAKLNGEVIVIDNGSLDGCVALLKALQREFGQALKVEYLPKNTGTTYSRNLALKQAKGDYLLVLDSDAYMNGEALAGMHNWLASQPEVGMVVPKLTYPDGRFQLSVDVFPTLTRKIQRFFSLKSMERSTDVNTDQPQDVDYAISACWFFSRDAYKRVGLLDENIFYAPEDVDYCLRIWKAGLRIVYLPTFSVVHDAQEISRGFKINKFTLLHIKGLFYYFIKHRYMFSLQGLYRRIGRYSS